MPIALTNGRRNTTENSPAGTLPVLLCLAFLAFCWLANAQPAAAQPPAECIPACRSGFMCVQGACVSACNPPCGAGEMCTAEGVCVVQTAAAPAAPPPAPGAAPPAGAADTSGAEPFTARAKPRSGLVLVPHVGVLLSGAGSLLVDPSCSGTGCADSGLGDNETVKYDDKSRLMLELDVLDHFGPKLRLGGGLMVVPSNSFEADTSSTKTKNGTELTPLAIVEGVFGDKIAGAVRGFVGMPILVPANDLDDLVESLEATCDELKASGASCSTGSGPFLGYTLGAAGGVVGQVGEGVALRGDLALQYQSIWGPSLEGSGNGTKVEVTTALSTTRVWLIGGIEF